MNPWDSIFASVPSTVTTIIGDLGTPLTWIVALGVVGTVIGMIASALGRD